MGGFINESTICIITHVDVCFLAAKSHLQLLLIPVFNCHSRQFLGPDFTFPVRFAVQELANLECARKEVQKLVHALLRVSTMGQVGRQLFVETSENSEVSSKHMQV